MDVPKKEHHERERLQHLFGYSREAEKDVNWSTRKLFYTCMGLAIISEGRLNIIPYNKVGNILLLCVGGVVKILNGEEK